MNSITINVNFANGEPVVNTAMPNKEEEAAERDNPFEGETIAVRSEVLLYRLADMGLLKHLVSVGVDPKTKKKSYTFEINDDVKEVYTKFFDEVEQKKREKRKESKENNKKETLSNEVC